MTIQSWRGPVSSRSLQYYDYSCCCCCCSYYYYYSYYYSYYCSYYCSYYYSYYSSYYYYSYSTTTTTTTTTPATATATATAATATAATATATATITATTNPWDYPSYVCCLRGPVALCELHVILAASHVALAMATGDPGVTSGSFPRPYISILGASSSWHSGHVEPLRRTASNDGHISKSAGSTGIDGCIKAGFFSIWRCRRHSRSRKTIALTEAFNMAGYLYFAWTVPEFFPAATSAHPTSSHSLPRHWHLWIRWGVVSSLESWQVFPQKVALTNWMGQRNVNDYK